MRALVLIAMVCVAGAALAHDKKQYADIDSKTKALIENLRDGGGTGCCSTADSTRVETVDWKQEPQDNDYRVRLGGEWRKITDKQLIKTPNPLGYAIVWYYLDTKGDVLIRCFWPGSRA